MVVVTFLLIPDNVLAVLVVWCLGFVACLIAGVILDERYADESDPRNVWNH